MMADFNNIWYTVYWGYLQDKLLIFHLTWIPLLHYLGKYEPCTNNFNNKRHTLLLHGIKIPRFPQNHCNPKHYSEIVQIASFLHTVLRSFKSFNQRQSWQCFLTSHFKCQIKPCLSSAKTRQLVSDTQDSASHTLYSVFNGTKIRANWRS